MPTSITVIHTDDFIRTTANGLLDLTESRRILTALVSAVRASGEIHVLVDVRAAASVLSRTDLLQIGVALGTQATLLSGRIALLVPLFHRDDAEFFEAIARLHGADVKAFTDFEAAITWLAIREPPAASAIRR